MSKSTLMRGHIPHLRRFGCKGKIYFLDCKIYFVFFDVCSAWGLGFLCSACGFCFLLVFFVSFLHRVWFLFPLVRAFGFMLAPRAHEKLKKKDERLEMFENYRKCSKVLTYISLLGVFPCRKRQRNEKK